jgi:uncharacterized phage protein (TIGR02216 family)
MKRPFPWAEAMQFGFGVLHLPSDAFWKMTPRELAQAIIAVRGRAPAPIERTEFDALMKAFPDHHTGVMRGLDPRIHPPSQESSEGMDCRVKPGNDGG